jgi:hypothetical protein
LQLAKPMKKEDENNVTLLIGHDYKDKNEKKSMKQFLM